MFAAVVDVRLWVLDRSVFQMITMRLGMERHSQLMDFLKKVEIFQNLSEDRISKMADVMDQVRLFKYNYMMLIYSGLLCRWSLYYS
jgi:hypothetical protein